MFLATRERLTEAPAGSDQQERSAQELIDGEQEVRLENGAVKEARRADAEHHRSIEEEFESSNVRDDVEQLRPDVVERGHRRSEQTPLREVFNRLLDGIDQQAQAHVGALKAAHQRNPLHDRKTLAFVSDHDPGAGEIVAADDHLPQHGRRQPLGGLHSVLRHEKKRQRPRVAPLRVRLGEDQMKVGVEGVVDEPLAPLQAILPSSERTRAASDGEQVRPGMRFRPPERKQPVLVRCGQLLLAGRHQRAVAQETRPDGDHQTRVVLSDRAQGAQDTQQVELRKDVAVYLAGPRSHLVEVEGRCRGCVW